MSSALPSLLEKRVVSSSNIVKVCVLLLDVTNIASVGLDRVRVIVSANSTIPSSTREKLIFCDVVPALNDSVPLANVKSTPPPVAVLVTV